MREEVTWIIEHHGVFQMFYYGDAAGVNKDERKRYRGHQWFDSCEVFCRDWDQMAFDPDYPTKPHHRISSRCCARSSPPPFDPAVITPEAA